MFGDGAWFSSLGHRDENCRGTKRGSMDDALNCYHYRLADRRVRVTIKVSVARVLFLAKLVKNVSESLRRG